ncbi:hypothetical protein BROUX41_001733 [Berkeleyomyces rouxiae]
MTPTITRIVRSFSSSAPIMPEGAEKVTVAAGCFWGVEHIYRKHFGHDKGLLATAVGYTGGNTSHPSYKNVCSGSTGHAEALEIVYDPKKVTYRQLIEFFYKIHDPTTLNRQGPDVGTQYRSAIFFHSPEQEEIAKEVTKVASENWWKCPLATQIIPAGEWWSAEDYHQLYLQNNPSGYECPTHFLRVFS